MSRGLGTLQQRILEALAGVSHLPVTDIAGLVYETNRVTDSQCNTVRQSLHSLEKRGQVATGMVGRRRGGIFHRELAAWIPGSYQPETPSVVIRLADIEKAVLQFLEECASGHHAASLAEFRLLWAVKSAGVPYGFLCYRIRNRFNLESAGLYRISRAVDRLERAGRVVSEWNGRKRISLCLQATLLADTDLNRAVKGNSHPLRV